MLSKTDLAVIRGTKKLMRKELLNIRLSRAMLQRRKKHPEWSKFYKELYQNALMLLRELQRMRGDYHSIPEKEVILNIEDNGETISFYFATTKAHVKICFKEDSNLSFRVSDIEEEIYEDALSLF